MTVHEKRLVKSKNRVQKYGEVFTPDWIVKKMLSEPSIQNKLHDIHATFLEPSVGEGAFVTEILHQKLTYVDEISNKSNWIKNTLWVIASIYGIELLDDNLIIAKQNLVEVLSQHYQNFYQKKLSKNTDLYKSARYIIDNNIVQGNTLKYITNSGDLIIFSEWIKRGDKVSQRQFTFKSLIESDNSNQYQSTEFIKINKVYKLKIEKV
ncbi:methylase [Ligilactobacillus salivarius]|uniref:methylase n=1 Tax=Ligilactobacillus salivarius TaxID=1624 RepID=UPI00399202E3